MTPGVRGEGTGEEEERERGVGRRRGEREIAKRAAGRENERGRELVRADAFPLANSRARDDWREREIGTSELNREKDSEGGRERGKENSEQEKRRSTGSEMGRKFSSSAFICSLNEMRMHYTWIAGDINFLPWTCSGPRARQGGRAVPGRAGPRAAKGVVERERVGGHPPGI